MFVFVCGVDANVVDVLMFAVGGINHVLRAG